jgi:hypothetical protein
VQCYRDAAEVAAGAAVVEGLGVGAGAAPGMGPAMAAIGERTCVWAAAAAEMGP